MENQTRKVTRDELDNGITGNNQVLCHAYYTNEGLTTKGGIILGFNTECTYSDDEGKDKSSHVADYAPTSLIVYRCPSRLYFNPEDNKGMDWETEMELAEGDYIWTNPIDALQSVTLECEGELYKLINYQDIYCYKREIMVDRWSTPQKKKIVTGCINGYLLCEQVHKPKLSDMDVTSEDKIDMRKGIVRYYGTPNTRYRNPELTDILGIQKGDTVIFDKKATFFLLERTPYSAKFSETLYWVIQRRQIAAIIR